MLRQFCLVAYKLHFFLGNSPPGLLPAGKATCPSGQVVPNFDLSGEECYLSGTTGQASMSHPTPWYSPSFAPSDESRSTSLATILLKLPYLAMLFLRKINTCAKKLIQPIIMIEEWSLTLLMLGKTINTMTLLFGGYLKHK